MTDENEKNNNFNIFFSFVDVVTGEKDNTFSSSGVYKGIFFTAYFKKGQWDELKEQINKTQKSWSRIKKKDKYEIESLRVVLI